MKCRRCGADLDDPAAGLPGHGHLEGCKFSKLSLLQADYRRLKARILRYTNAALHPYGRCTCSGEGTCEWCQRLCPECLGAGCPKCRQTGWQDSEHQERVLAALDRDNQMDEAAKVLKQLKRRVRSKSTGASIDLALAKMGRLHDGPA
jgi:hypothetical protein